MPALCIPEFPQMADEPRRTGPPPAGSRPEWDESSLALVLRARQGDRQALDAVCARYLPRLRQWAHGRLPRAARGLLETEDILQETLSRAVVRLPELDIRTDGAFLAYLRQAIANRLKDEGRRYAVRPMGETLDTQVVDEALSPLEKTIGANALASYEAGLERLREDERNAIVARIELGCSYDEIAQAIGKSSADAARMAVTRALVRLAEEMGRDDIGGDQGGRP